MISEPIQVCYSNFSPFPNPAVLNIPRRYSDNKIVNKPASPMRKRTRFETAMIFRPILPLPPSLPLGFCTFTEHRVFRYRGWILSHLSPSRVNLFQPCKRFSSIGRLWGAVRASRRRKGSGGFSRDSRDVTVSRACTRGYRWRKNSIHEFVDRSRPRCIGPCLCRLGAPHCARINYAATTQRGLDSFPPNIFSFLLN